MSALQSLLVRVEEATGPNFELERALFETLAMPEEWFGARVTGHFRIGDGYGFNTEDGFRHLDTIKAPAYTASLDAALALCSRVLPGYMWDLHFTQGSEPVYVANLLPPAGRFLARSKTPALALLAAMLKALVAQGEDGKS